VRKYLSLSLLLFLIGLLCLAQQPSKAFWQSRDSNYNKSASVAAAYTGAGDCSGCTTFNAFWSTRAYSAATRGTKAVNVCNITGGVDVACADFSTDATTGALTISLIGGLSCSVVTCAIKKFYDQSGANACSGSPCDATQATVANRATLTVSCQNSQPCAVFPGNPVNYTFASMGSNAQPLGMTAVLFPTATTAGGIIAFNSGTDPDFLINSNVMELYAGGGAFTATANVSNWFAVQAVFNGATSVLNVNGSETTPGTNPGANGTTTSGFIGNDGFAAFLQAKFVEGGVKLATLSAGNRSSLSSNQRTFWGF